MTSVVRRLCLPLLLLISSLAGAQTFDSSGNALLSGAYNFRQVVWIVNPNSSTGNLSRAIALYGTLNFDGAGKYTLASQVYDSSAASVQPFSTSGSYVITASGWGYIQSPLFTDGSGTIFGSVANGVFVGSSTEDGLNDLFVAAKPPATGTVAALNDTYTAAMMDYPSSSLTLARSATFDLSPNGAGSLGASTATGYVGAATGAITQSIPPATYTLVNGAGTMAFGGTASASTFITGNKVFYTSADGNFVFGGSSTGWDIFVGVRSASGSDGRLLPSGLFLQAGVRLNNNSGTTRTYYGSLNQADAITLGHQRQYNGFATGAIDYNYSDDFLPGADGAYTDFFSMKHMPSRDGSIIIGSGIGPRLGLDIELRAAPIVAPGVYLSPVGVVNAASYSPFTTGIAPGELITLFGAGMASQFSIDTTFPRSIDGVLVLINGRQCPVLYVSPNQVAVVAPFATLENFANVQVINNGVASNTISVFVNSNSPGIFTDTAGGYGTAKALHPDGTEVTRGKPAQPGEVIAVFMSGLGPVLPAVADGAFGPAVEPLSRTISSFNAYVDDQVATVSYFGLAPQLIGLYQLNVQIPAGTASGNAFLDVEGPGSYNTQVTVPVSQDGSALTVVRSAREARSAQDDVKIPGSSLPVSSRSLGWSTRLPGAAAPQVRSFGEGAAQ